MIPLTWRQPLRAARVVLAVGCVLSLLLAARFSVTSLAVLFAAYTIYALVGYSGKSLEESGYPIFALMVDVFFLFLILASNLRVPDWLAILFFIYSICFSVLDREWWWPALITAASVVILNYSQPAQYSVLLPAVAASGILGTLLAIERRLINKRLDKAARQSVIYRYDADKARELERQRIAADFHDGPLQSFISFQMRLEVIRKLLSRDREAAYDELRQLQDLCKDQVLELRAFVRSMRPVDVSGSLNASLRRVVSQFQKDTNIPTTFASADFVEPSDPEVALELLQIVREALYNIQKHSAATRVAVTIRNGDRSMEISIEDNGSGFPFTGSYTLEELELLRMGPGSIKRRVRSLGGELLLDSKPGHGTGLKVRLAT